MCSSDHHSTGNRYCCISKCAKAFQHVVAWNGGSELHGLTGHRPKVRGGENFKESSFYTQVIIWNELPEQNIIAMVKRHLDKYLDKKGIMG